MFTNTTNTRIAASRREIGLLRAVGADVRQVTARFAAEFSMTFFWGALTGVFVTAVLCAIGVDREMLDASIYRYMWIPPLYLMGIFGLCYGHLRLQIRKALQTSIVSSIQML